MAEQNGGTQQEPKTFTQEEVNELMGRTRREERGKYADYEDLKALNDPAQQQGRSTVWLVRGPSLDTS